MLCAVHSETRSARHTTRSALFLFIKMILVLPICLSGSASVYAISDHPSFFIFVPRSNRGRYVKREKKSYNKSFQITRKTVVPYPVRAEIELKSISIRL